MADVIWRERPELRAPVLVCAFKGWNDAGEAASAALAYIRGSFDAREVAALELAREEVRVAERAARDRARAIAQLDGEVRRPVLGREAILAGAGEHPLDLAAGPQLGDRHE